MRKFRLPVSRPRFSLRANSLKPMPGKTSVEAKTRDKKQKRQDSVRPSSRQKNRNNRIRRLSR